MTAQQLKAAARALYGVNWPLKLFADDLDVADRSLRRWIAGSAPVPDGLMAAIHQMLRERRALIDELLGDGAE